MSRTRPRAAMLPSGDYTETFIAWTNAVNLDPSDYDIADAVAAFEHGTTATDFANAYQED